MTDEVKKEVEIGIRESNGRFAKGSPGFAAGKFKRIHASAVFGANKFSAIQNLIDLYKEDDTSRREKVEINKILIKYEVPELKAIDFTVGLEEEESAVGHAIKTIVETKLNDILAGIKNNG